LERPNPTRPDRKGVVAPLSLSIKAHCYGISKFGIVSLTQTLGREWATRGVRVNAIAPGFFMTALNESKMSAERKSKRCAERR
jgi:NAD(P)-dependent dehydrogenase (short-subunit alcohol dehydrogenase family)